MNIETFIMQSYPVYNEVLYRMWIGSCLLTRGLNAGSTPCLLVRTGWACIVSGEVIVTYYKKGDHFAVTYNAGHFSSISLHALISISVQQNSTVLSKLFFIYTNTVKWTGTPVANMNYFETLDVLNCIKNV